jgi:hypothetical protein
MPVSVWPKISYVRNRLGRTSWADRGTIHDLLTLENYFSGSSQDGLHSLWVRRGLPQVGAGMADRYKEIVVSVPCDVVAFEIVGATALFERKAQRSA